MESKMRKNGQLLIKIFVILFFLSGILGRKLEVAPNIFAGEQDDELTASNIKMSHKKLLDQFGINHNEFSQYETIRRSRRNGSDKPTADSLNIWILNLQTKDLLQMTFDGGYLSPIMSPDDIEVWYVFRGTIWKMNLDGSNKRQAFSQNKEVRLLLRWLNNNKERLVFLTENNEIFTIEIQSGKLQLALSTSASDDDADFISKLIEFTRTSKENVFVFDDVYQNKWDILLKRKDNKYNDKLTNDEYIDRDPSWSTDEKSILFVSDR